MAINPGFVDVNDRTRCGQLTIVIEALDILSSPVFQVRPFNKVYTVVDNPESISYSVKNSPQGTPGDGWSYAILFYFPVN
jgi:hypothetical protein